MKIRKLKKKLYLRRTVYCLSLPLLPPYAFQRCKIRQFLFPQYVLGRGVRLFSAVACERVVTVLQDAQTYTLAEKMFYSAIADFSAMLTSDTARTYKSLMTAVHKSISGATANMSWVQQTYNAMRRFARCQWSPLAVPLPFASTYKQREILGCTRREEVCQPLQPRKYAYILLYYY